MITSPIAKRLKTGAGPLIATHNGHFHADEALAVYLLRLLPAYNSSSLLRTRDPNILSTAHTVVDVGGEYSASNNRFDHHQRNFDTTFPTRRTKLSSAGLVYLHFGKAIIAQMTKLDSGSQDVEILWRKLYDDFVEAIDANDNGISVYDPAETKTLQKRFYDSGINLGSLVGDLNYYDHDDQDVILTKEQAQELEDARFMDASSFMGETFLRKLKYMHRAWLPARTLVHETYMRRKEYDAQGRIMVFERGCPWKDHVYALEAEQQEEGGLLYVLYPENAHEGSKWRIQAVSQSNDSFESRKALPAEWRGLRDQDLDKIAEVEGCVFVHASGFIGGNMNKQGALQMAQKAVAM